MNISSIDLNLLHVLHAVLTDLSATKAAKRLHVTQSAVSNALARLRTVFGDPLVVRTARGLAPTPRALSLRPDLDRVMAEVAALVDPRVRFDPATTTREFCLSCPDYLGSVLVAPLSERLSERAPNAKLAVVALEQMVATQGLASTVDVHVGMPPRIAAGCRSRTLFDDRFVCVVPARGAKRTRFSVAEYVAARHMRISVLGSRTDPIDVALAAKGYERNVVLTVPFFASAAAIVERTGYVATLSRRLAENQARSFRVALREPPLALGVRASRMVWHERTEADPGARFFRKLVEEVAAG
jgi:DNA-binding transcriptional LysR family regulator